jgi:adenylate cyclase
MPISIIFHRLGRFEVEPGTTILEAAKRFGLFHADHCGGRAECTTCRVWVIAGEQNCSAQQEPERCMLKKHHLKPPIRLACQTRILGPMRVQILLRNEDEVQTVTHLATINDGTMPGMQIPLVIMKAAIHDYDEFVKSNIPYEAIHILQKFRGLSESLLAEYQGHMCEAKGPSFTAVFGLEGDTAEAIPRALGCARRLVVGFQEVNEYLERYCDVRRVLGVGLHAGVTIAGHIGGEGRRQLCILGEAPRVAEHLLHLTKSAPAAILISEAIFAVVRDRFPIARAFSARTPGKDERLNVFEVAAQSSGLVVGAGL